VFPGGKQTDLMNVDPNVSPDYLNTGLQEQEVVDGVMNRLRRLYHGTGAALKLGDLIEPGTPLTSVRGKRRPTPT
jgi:hypothetical protein